MADRPADNLQELPQQIQRMLDHYRLVDNPFGKAVDAKVFSRTGNRAAVATQIERLFRSTATECLLIAPAGGGKRTLARQVARQLGVGWRLAWVDGWEILDAVDLVRELVAQLRLGQKVEGAPEEMSRQVAELVARKAAGGENCLLVVQHADQLTPEMQRWLRSLGRHGGRLEMRLRQLWLAESAQPIEEADEGHQWTATTLDPLTDAEALEYLRDRFAAAGRFEGLPIEEGEVARLNRVAGGWPGRLNEAARDYLIAANKRALEWRPATGLLYGVIGVAVLAAVAVTTVRYLSSQPEPHTTDQSPAGDPEPAPDQAAPDSAIDEPDAGGQRSTSEGEPASVTAGEDDEAVPVTAEQSRDTGTASGDPEPMPSDERDAEPARPDEDDAQPIPAGEGEAAAGATEVADTGPTSSDEDDAEATSAKSDDARPEAAGEPPVYTVQLAGARSVDSLLTLRNELGIGVDTSIARTTLDGEPWYVLIAGRHDTVEQARGAIAALPPEIRARSPWPRALSDLEVLESPQPSGDARGETAAAGEGGAAASAPSAPFTLQLAGVRDRGSLEALVAELESPERYEIMTTTLDGRPWYVLTHGRFETAEAARAAIERLPDELRRYSPWPRPVSDFDAAAPGQED